MMQKLSKSTLQSLLLSRTPVIAKLIGQLNHQGNWTLIVTLEGNYAIRTPKQCLFPKNQDFIDHAHYRYNIRMNKEVLESFKEQYFPHWYYEIASMLVSGINKEIDNITWY